MALLGFPVATGVSTAGKPGSCGGPFLASRTRARLPHEVHTAIFDWVLALIAEAGLVKGERIGVDASTMEANAARNIVRRDTGEGYRGMLARLAQESGIETPTAEDLARLDRKRKGKKLSNQDWVSKSDPEAKIAKMKDGTTHLAYKPETRGGSGHRRGGGRRATPGRRGRHDDAGEDAGGGQGESRGGGRGTDGRRPGRMCDRQGLSLTVGLKGARRRPLEDADLRAQAERFCALARRRRPRGQIRTRGNRRTAARRAVTNNRTRLLSGVAKEAFKLRAEIVERSFAHNLDRGGMRRTWLRGRENVHKRYLLHVAGHNLSLLMRKLIGAGTPQEAVAGGYGCICVLIAPAGAVLVAQMVLIVSEDGETAFVALCFAVE